MDGVHELLDFHTGIHPRSGGSVYPKWSSDYGTLFIISHWRYSLKEIAQLGLLASRVQFFNVPKSVLVSQSVISVKNVLMNTAGMGLSTRLQMHIILFSKAITALFKQLDKEEHHLRVVLQLSIPMHFWDFCREFWDLCWCNEHLFLHSEFMYIEKIV